MADASEAVRIAVMTRLKAALPAASGYPALQVYSDPPANMALPAVTLDRVIDEPDDLLADDVSIVTVTLTIWSGARGPKQTAAVRSAIRELMHDADLDLETGGAVMCRYVRGDVTRDSDGQTYMGSVMLRVTTEH